MHIVLPLHTSSPQQLRLPAFGDRLSPFALCACKRSALSYPASSACILQISTPAAIATSSSTGSRARSSGVRILSAPSKAITRLSVHQQIAMRRSSSKDMNSHPRRSVQLNSLNSDDNYIAIPTEDAAEIEVARKTASPSTSEPASTRKASGKKRIFGLEPSAELVAISLVYFVQGILGLARLAVSFYYKDELQLDPATTGVLMTIAGLPWVIKPLYGFLSDTVPLFGYRRRSYLVLCGLLGTLSWVALATYVSTPSAAVFMLVLGSLSTACSDVVVDSIVVERCRGEPQATAGSLQSLCWASAAIGGVASAYFSGALVESWGTRGVFGATALFPLLISISAVLIDEQPVSAKGNPGSTAVVPPPEQLLQRAKLQAKALWNAINQRSILMPAIFVFLWQATPSADSAMFFFQTNELHFSAEFLGRVRLIGSMASLAGVGTYNFLLKDVPLRTMFLWTALIGTGLGLTQLILITGLNKQLGLSNELFVLGDSLVLTVLGQVSFMPLLVLAARLCPEGVEATLFATLMSVLNGGAFTGSFLGSLLTRALGVTSTDFTNLAPLVAICTLSTLAPLPLLKRMVPDASANEEVASAAEANENGARESDRAQD